MLHSRNKPALTTRFVTKTGVFIAAGLISITTMAAQFSTAPTLLSVNGVTIVSLGYSAALSADGNTALLGGSGKSGGATTPDAAYIYTRSNGAWGNPVELSQSGVPSSNNLGYSVSLSANGQVALVGSPITNTAYVYTNTNGTWSAPVVLSTSEFTPVTFGNAVALSADGKTALVGDNNANSSGAVYVYTYNGSAWSSGTALLPTSLPSHSQYGYSIALSSNGSTGLVALIGAVQGGAVYVSSYNGSSWSNPTALSTSGITQTAGTFGSSVALSANGQTAVVGSGAFNGGTGAAYVYTETGGTWSTPTTLARPTGASAFGWSVGITPSGAEVFVGAPFGTPNSGAIYAYTYSGSSWSAGTALPASSVQPQAALGYSLAVGADGQEVIGGAVAANGGTGGAYVYESPAAVTLSVSATPTSVVPGNNLTFNLTFTNADTASGGLPAVNLTDVVLTDTLPAGTTYVSSNAANGSCSHTSTTVTCTLASLPAGTNSQNPWQPSIVVKTPSTASRLTNTVSMSADEPLTGSSSASTTVINDVKPTVANGSLSTSPSTAVSGTLSATPGFSSQMLTFTIVEQPSNGTLSAFNAATGTFTYTPKTGFTGTDLFIFTAGDGIVTSAPAAESITVSTPTGPPTANNGSVTTAENTPVTGILQYLGSGSLTFAIVSQPAHGSVTTPDSGGVFTYTPNTGYNGIDTFTFTVANGLGKSNTATETVTVSATLNQPVAADVSLTAYENSTLSGTLPAVDAAGNPLSYAVTQPTHGAVTVTAATGAFTYTPTSDYTGDDSFTFTATDTVTNLTSNTATISIDVKAIPSSGSSGSSSSSSGKSGGGALGLLGLGLLGFALVRRRRRT